MADDLLSFEDDAADDQEIDPSAAGLESNPKLRYVFIEYMLPYEVAELSRGDPEGRTGLIEESGFRSSTLVSGFKHATLVLLQSNASPDVLEGVRWSVGKNKKNEVTVKRGVPWRFLSSSKSVFDGFTLKDNAEINAIVDQCIRQNSRYELLNNNCEVFCLAVSKQITLRNEGRSLRSQHYRRMKQTFQKLGSSGIAPVKDTESQTSASAFMLVLIPILALFFLEFAVLIYIVSHFHIIGYSDQPFNIPVPALILILTGMLLLIWIVLRPRLEHRWRTPERLLTDHGKIHYWTVIASLLICLFLTILGLTLVLLLGDNSTAKGSTSAYLVVLGTFLTFLLVQRILWQLCKPRQRNSGDDAVPEDEQDGITELDHEQEEVLESEA